MVDETGKLIKLTDILETKLRKERELEFYQKELEKMKIQDYLKTKTDFESQKTRIQNI